MNENNKLNLILIIIARLVFIQDVPYSKISIVIF